jgi:hypothetical protein
MNQTMPVIDHFKASGRLRHINTARDIEVIFDELKGILKV